MTKPNVTALVAGVKTFIELKDGKKLHFFALQPVADLFAAGVEEANAAFDKIFTDPEAKEAFVAGLRKELGVEDLTTDNITNFGVVELFLQDVTPESETDDVTLINSAIAFNVATLDLYADEISDWATEQKINVKKVDYFTEVEIPWVSSHFQNTPAEEAPAAETTAVETPTAEAPEQEVVAETETPAVETPASESVAETLPATPAQLTNPLLNSIATALRQQAQDLKLDREDMQIIRERFQAMETRYNGRAEAFENNLTGFLDAVQSASTPQELVQAVSE